MNRGYVLIIILSIVLIAGCTQTGIHADDSGATPEGLKSVVDANSKFALDMYSEINNGTNVFFSPYSISSAFAIAYEGARGKTAEDIQAVLHFPEDNTVRRSSFARIYNLLNQGNKDYQLSTANALWAQKDFPFLDDYKNISEKYYGGKTTNLDFIGDTENSRVTINNWVEQQTNNKIKDLIPKGTLNAMTRLVITNAIYFKGFWVNKFDVKNTAQEDFYLDSGEAVKVPMMNLADSELNFNYAENEDLQVLEMPYRGGNLSMIILLPAKGKMGELENSLSLEKLTTLENKLTYETVYIHMPKFTFETKYFLVDTLKGMGMNSPFDKSADFSGMDEGKDLFISSVIHQAFVAVDEEGTEAAAATSIGVSATAVRYPKDFRADHPFIFIIQDKSTGSILFLGKVVDPRSS